METTLENVPKKWRFVVLDTLTHMPPLFVALAHKHGAQLSMRETSTRCVDGVIQKEHSHYSEKNKKIYMDGNKDSDEFSESFRHEYGHFMDDMLGRISLTDNFGFALEADQYWINNSSDQGRDNLSTMLSELSTSDAINSRYISDILSGITINDTNVCEIYNSQGLPFYGHSIEYWMSWDEKDKIVERETFANLYAIYSKGEQADILFVERWFPNVTSRFKKELEKKLNGQ